MSLSQHGLAVGLPLAVLALGVLMTVFGSGKHPGAGMHSGRWGRPATLHALLLAVVALVGLSLVAFPSVMGVFGISHGGFWFRDLYAVLASSDAARAGYNPYQANPLASPHLYSSWWFVLGRLGLTRMDTGWLGVTVTGVFIALAWLQLRPRTWRQWMQAVAVLCSPAFVLAVNRGNADLWIFILLSGVVPCLLSSHRLIQLLMAPLIAVAAGLKFYPASALALIWSVRPPRWLMMLGGILLGLLILVGWNVSSQFKSFQSTYQLPYGLFTFGAPMFFKALGWQGAWTKIITLCGIALVMRGWLRKAWLREWKPAPAQRGNYLRFMLGSILVLTSFVGTVSYAYRFVFVLWFLPLLWSEQDSGGPRQRLAIVTSMLLFVQLWLDPLVSFYFNIGFSAADLLRLMPWERRVGLLEQPVTWGLIVCLLAYLAHFTREGFVALRGPMSRDL